MRFSQQGRSAPVCLSTAAVRTWCNFTAVKYTALTTALAFSLTYDLNARHPIPELVYWETSKSQQFEKFQREDAMLKEPSINHARCLSLFDSSSPLRRYSNPLFSPSSHSKSRQVVLKFVPYQDLRN